MILINADIVLHSFVAISLTSQANDGGHTSRGAMRPWTVRPHIAQCTLASFGPVPVVVGDAQATMMGPLPLGMALGVTVDLEGARGNCKI